MGRAGVCALDFSPAMGYLGKDKRVAYALGCVGHGVAMMNMSGQIMRDLVLARDAEFTNLFFVNRGVVPLPPEPLRFVLGESIRRALKAQDAWEARRGSGGWRARAEKSDKPVGNCDLPLSGRNRSAILPT